MALRAFWHNIVDILSNNRHSDLQRNQHLNLEKKRLTWQFFSRMSVCLHCNGQYVVAGWEFYKNNALSDEKCSKGKKNYHHSVQWRYQDFGWEVGRPWLVIWRCCIVMVARYMVCVCVRVNRLMSAGRLPLFSFIKNVWRSVDRFTFIRCLLQLDLHFPCWSFILHGCGSSPPANDVFELSSSARRCLVSPLI